MNYYNDFGQVYDVLTQNIDYKSIASFIKNISKNIGVKGNIFLDVGCGTGSLCEEMFKLEYDVLGIELSESMISCAMEKKYEKNLNILYLNQDMRYMDMYGTIDIISCTLDTVNHLENNRDVLMFFKKVELFLDPEGVFIFDMNTIYKHQNILKDNIFTYDYEDVFCVWQNQLMKENIVKITLNIFTKKEDNEYYRLYEEIDEKAYTEEEIEDILDLSGLKVVNKYDGHTFENIQKKSERITYVVVKKGRFKNNE
ncbi:MAG: class I SAM-dependent methyltransferase [Oscillospiraceae bacterium]|nr:class I SAM-dependent methyltransferase [Oscillospiraceae bacterium]